MKIPVDSRGRFIKGYVSPKRNGEQRTCNCGTVFYKPMSRILSGKGLYCSIKCRALSQSGAHLSPRTEFKKGERLGEKHPNWKGENVGYYALHAWVYRNLGRPKCCEHCASTTNLQWANKSHEYRRDLMDWLSLCQVCHRKHDGCTKLSKEDVPLVKDMYSNGLSQTDIAHKFNVHQSTISNLLRSKIKFYA